MPNTHCYHCGSPLTPANRSQEHIIPNAIGGRWKSTDLWCADCNRHFGATIDAVLCRDLSPFATLLDIGRERGENQVIKNAHTGSGGRYHIGKGITPIDSKPTVQINKDTQTVHISARNEEEVFLLVKQLKEKYPGLDDSDLASKFVVNNRYISESLHFQSGISGPAFIQAVLKIAVSAWLENTKDPATIASAIADLKRSPENIQIYHRHYYTPELCHPDADSVEHIIYIKGEPEKSLLYAYVELFSTYAFVFNLNDRYTGGACTYLYRCDVLTGAQSNMAPTINYTGTLPDKPDLNRHFIELLQVKFDRLMSIADRRAESYHVGQLAERAFKSVIDKHPKGSEITESIMAEITTEVTRLSKEYARHMINMGLRKPANKKTSKD
ncbi:MAG TPA: HNH endonuclease [Niabella sp.]